MIKYDCDTHCIYSEEGYNLSHLYFEDSTNVLSLYKKDDVETKKVNVYKMGTIYLLSLKMESSIF